MLGADDYVLDGSIGSALGAATDATLLPTFFPDALAGGLDALPSVDTWGAITIPAQGPLTGYPAGDPALRYILDFLKAFIVTDANATLAWSAVYPARPPIFSTFAHNPAEEVFSTSFLPALFLWRESATQEWAAEDWLREMTEVKGLWVFPLALPSNQRLRSPFVNALCKALTVGIERGRTPGYVVPGDPDPASPAQGSLLYTFAGFEYFALKKWRAFHLPIEVDAKGEQDFPAIELTFDLWENLEYGLDRFAPNSPNAGTYLTLLNDQGQTLVSGPA